MSTNAPQVTSAPQDTEPTFAIPAKVTLVDGMVRIEFPVPKPHNVGQSSKGKPFVSLRWPSGARFAIAGKPFHVPAGSLGYLPLSDAEPKAAPEAGAKSDRRMYFGGTK